jgi:hypothetical protein
MEKERNNRVAMTTEVKKEVFMAYFLMVSHGILEFGAFKVKRLGRSLICVWLQCLIFGIQL